MGDMCWWSTCSDSKLIAMERWNGEEREGGSLKDEKHWMEKKGLQKVRIMVKTGQRKVWSCPGMK